MTASLELVVAHFQEDLRWLRRVPKGLAISVYHKGGRALPGAVVLPNVGREAHTYLHHIVSRYDSLAEVTVFAQGHPFDHVHDFHPFLRRLAAGEEEVEDFRWLGFVLDWDDSRGERLFQGWSKNPERRPLPMALFWERLGEGPRPEVFVFYPGAHFAVTRQQALARPRHLYERALTLSAELPDAAHCFERCWDHLFGVAGAPAGIAISDLPLFKKPIRRLREAPAAAHPLPRLRRSGGP
ncbi:MAG: DUF3431 domain-containing protein [Thermodesulfobacteriota bacterium]